MTRVSLPSASRRAVAGGREEAADAGAGGADALGQVALRHQFELDLAGAVQRIEHMRIALPRERADDLAHPAGFQQRRQAEVAIAGVVVDQRQLTRALGDEGVDQRRGLPGAAEVPQMATDGGICRHGSD